MRYARGRGSIGDDATVLLILTGGVTLALVLAFVAFVLATTAKRLKSQQSKKSTGLYVGAGLTAAASVLAFVLPVVFARQWAEQIDQNNGQNKTAT